MKTVPMIDERILSIYEEYKSFFNIPDGIDLECWVYKRVFGKTLIKEVM